VDRKSSVKLTAPPKLDTPPPLPMARGSSFSTKDTSSPPPPPPRAPSPPPAPPASIPPPSSERNELLSNIRNFNGKQLKKTETVDKSAPMVSKNSRPGGDLMSEMQAIRRKVIE